MSKTHSKATTTPKPALLDLSFDSHPYITDSILVVVLYCTVELVFLFIIGIGTWGDKPVDPSQHLAVRLILVSCMFVSIR